MKIDKLNEMKINEVIEIDAAHLQSEEDKASENDIDDDNFQQQQDDGQQFQQDKKDDAGDAKLE